MPSLIRDQFGVIRMVRPGERDPCSSGADTPVDVEVDECGGAIRFNGTEVPLSIFHQCLKVATGFGPPIKPPTNGYLPQYLDISGSAPHKLYIYAGGSWYLTGG